MTSVRGVSCHALSHKCGIHYTKGTLKWLTHYTVRLLNISLPHKQSINVDLGRKAREVTSQVEISNEF